MDFDFLTAEAEPEYIPPKRPHGPNGKTLRKVNAKTIRADFYELYEELGGKDHLKIALAAEPKLYCELIKKSFPTNVELDLDEGLKINLIERYNPNINCASGRDLDMPRSTGELPEPRVADEGSSPPHQPETVLENSPVEVKERFDFTV